MKYNIFTWPLQRTTAIVSVVQQYERVFERVFVLALQVFSCCRMTTKIEQRYVVHYCVRCGLTPTETVNEIQGVYWADCLNRCTIFRWHHWFWMGRESVELIAQGGQLHTSTSRENVKTICVIIREDRYASVWRLAVQMNLSNSSIHRILAEHLHMQCVCSLWVPHLLTMEQLERQVKVSCEQHCKMYG